MRGISYVMLYPALREQYSTNRTLRQISVARATAKKILSAARKLVHRI
jgi:uncharacterized membrane protein